MVEERAFATCDPTDPRVRRTRTAVHEATIDVMIDTGFAGLTIEAVAQRAEVARTTIYRNWSGKAQLVVDAIESLGAPPTVEPGGDVREDLLLFLGHLASELPAARWASVIAALTAAAEHDPDLARERQRMVERRQQAVATVIRSAVERGQLDADTDPQLMVSMLAGPMFYRRLLSREAMGGDFVTLVVDKVLSGFGYSPVADPGRTRA